MMDFPTAERKIITNNKYNYIVLLNGLILRNDHLRRHKSSSFNKYSRCFENPFTCDIILTGFDNIKHIKHVCYWLKPCGFICFG